MCKASSIWCAYVTVKSPTFYRLYGVEKYVAVSPSLSLVCTSPDTFGVAKVPQRGSFTSAAYALHH